MFLTAIVCSQNSSKNYVRILMKNFRKCCQWHTELMFLDYGSSILKKDYFILAVISSIEGPGPWQRYALSDVLLSNFLISSP